MQRRRHGLSPESDDFAARYDRMVERGPARGFLITVVVIAGILAVIAVVRVLLGI